MIEAIYRTLNSLGYTHPLHPTLTHVVIGMVIGGFVLALVAWVFNRPGLAQSGGHCMALALIFLFPTAALGYADWQHFYGGAWLFPIKMKLVLAVVLLVLLILALGVRRGTKVVSGKTVAVYGLGLLTVVAMGYFGGELVWGKRAQVAVMAGNPVQQGAALFERSTDNALSNHAFFRTPLRRGGRGPHCLFENLMTGANRDMKRSEWTEDPVLVGRHKLTPCVI
jgi:uncharacterized membrane protein